MKKVGFVIPSFMYEILIGDSEYFKLTLGEIGNRILSYYLGKDINKIDFKSASNERIQFNLSKNNEEIFLKIIEEENIQKEAGYLRNIYFTYVNNLRYVRERILFKEIFKEIEEAINKNRKIKIKYHSYIRTVNPYLIKVANKEERSYLFCFCEKNNDYRVYRISEIEKIWLTTSEVEIRDKYYIEKIKENFDPFLSFNKHIKVRFTEIGIKRYEKALLNRPKLVSQDKNIYIFQCSEKHAKVYFAQFYSEVEILEPKSLREEFKKEFIKILSLYD